MSTDTLPADLQIPALAADEIHVWAVSSTADQDAVEALATCLSAHERHRATRMRHPDARRAFVVGRARVRQILARYVAQCPANLDVVTRVDHRPVLAGAPHWFDFSFSRCDGLHVCAVARDRRVGIDVEPIETCRLDYGGSGERETRADARDLFSLDDFSWLDAQPVHRRDAARAELLTKKEALVKAVGGVTVPLSAIEVPRGDDGQVTISISPQRTGRWLVRSLVAASGIVCAVAADGEWRLTPLRYPSAPAGHPSPTVV